MVRLKATSGKPSKQARLGFNSTMVRLKAEKTRWDRIRVSCFNSTMVRLKETAVPREKQIMKCFNSTMVRLKEDGDEDVHKASLEFQFHNGSIKSDLQRHQLRWYQLVSIPQWFD